MVSINSRWAFYFTAWTIPLAAWLCSTCWIIWKCWALIIFACWTCPEAWVLQITATLIWIWEACIGDTLWISTVPLTSILILACHIIWMIVAFIYNWGCIRCQRCISIWCHSSCIIDCRHWSILSMNSCPWTKDFVCFFENIDSMTSVWDTIINNESYHYGFCTGCSISYIFSDCSLKLSIFCYSLRHCWSIRRIMTCLFGCSLSISMIFCSKT